MVGRRGFIVGAVVAVAVACQRAVTQPPSVPPVATGPDPSGPTGEPAPAPSTPELHATDAASSAPTTEPPIEPTPEPTVEVPVVAQVLCRDAWGAAPADPDDRRHTPTRVTIHHTAAVLTDNREAPRRWRAYQRFHQDQDWSDIAYHVGVDRGGNLYELRRPDVPGDTFTDYDPAGHHLIVADGNFEEQSPSAEQVEAMAQAAAAACRTYGVDPATIGGHRDHASTSCPGQGLYDLLPAIRTRAADLLSTGFETAILCGPDADARIATIEA